MYRTKIWKLSTPLSGNYNNDVNDANGNINDASDDVKNGNDDTKNHNIDFYNDVIMMAITTTPTGDHSISVIKRKSIGLWLININ